MDKNIGEALTFDDVLIVPCYSEVTPDMVDVTSFLTPSIRMNVPLVSSPMDTVTEANMATAMAKNGGVGVIHKNMSIESQKNEVEKVKQWQIKGEQNNCPKACKNNRGELIVGGAVGVGTDCLPRVEALLAAGADFIVVDSAHGHSANVIRSIGEIKAAWPNCQLIAGNVVSSEGARAILEAGADTIKVGIGAGSICTTRIIAGVGVPQITAIAEVVKIAAKMNRCVIADGGIKYSGDIVKAIAMGANCVMCGNLFAGCDETPGEKISADGRQYKIYRGMGSEEAMKSGSADRYSQNSSKKFVPEGVIGRVQYKGPVGDIIYQLVGGLRSGMGYVGAATLEELRKNAKFVKINAAGLRESHIHDITMVKEPPNYKVCPS
ncbi:MAG: IMP dehydrogenase [Puniceicoccales bacterium]|jgi:IMP dehydrogenase|nr:IMP dehydrogenase [Puniceicoccales bacterium]